MFCIISRRAQEGRPATQSTVPEASRRGLVTELQASWNSEHFSGDLGIWP